MNEELQKALTEILNGVLTAKDFMLAELPEVIQQLLVWKFWYYVVDNCIGIIIFIVGIFVTRYCHRLIQGVIKKQESYESWELLYLIVIVGWIIPCIMISCYLNITWLQIWLAPKVYLIEYAASLTK